MDPRFRRSARSAVCLGVMGALLAAAQPAAAAIVGTTSAPTVANAIGPSSGAAFVFGGGVGVGPRQAGTEGIARSGFPTAGGSYGILTSGDSELGDDPNDFPDDGDNLGIEDPTRGDANDSQTLRIDFTVPGGSNCLNIDYKFFSEEFPEFVNAGFNDGFVAELDSTNWRTENQKILAPLDFAAGYGDQVSVDTVGPTIVAAANSAGTTYDAATTTLTAKVVVTPGVHAVYLSIFDAGDHIYDSAVFLDALRFTTEPAESCKSPDLFGGAVGAGVKGKFKVKGKNLLVPINCQLPEGASDPCVGNVLVTANVPSGGAAAAKKVTIAKGSYSVEPASSGKARTKLTKRGKKLLKRKGKLKAKVRVTNSINGAKKTFKAKL
jgi:hypothetical protein